MRHLDIRPVAQSVDGSIGSQSKVARRFRIAIILVHCFRKVQVELAQAHQYPGMGCRRGVVGRDVHVCITIFPQIVTRLCGVEQWGTVSSAFKGFYGHCVVVGPHIPVLHHRHAETRIQSAIGILSREVDGCTGMALAERLACAVSILVSIYQGLRGAHATLSVLHADGIVVGFPCTDRTLL